MLEYQRISAARAWRGNPLVLALTHLAFGVSAEIPVKIQVVAPESWGFLDGEPFFLPEVIAAPREGLREMLSQRLPVWTSQARLLFLLESETGVPEQYGVRGSIAA